MSKQIKIISVTLIIAITVFGFYNYNFLYARKLNYSIKANDEIAVNEILKKPGNINSLPYIPSIFGANNTPITEACYEGNINIIKILIEHGASMNPRKPSWRPLEVVCQRYYPNKLEVVKVLIENGADVNLVKDSYGDTPILIETRKALLDEYGEKSKEEEMINFEVFMFLVENGADIFIENASQRNVLFNVAFSDNILIARYLLETEEFEINKQDAMGWTPLIYACKYNSNDVAKLLIENNADKSIKDNYGKTALDYAIENGNEELIELLQEN